MNSGYIMGGSTYPGRGGLNIEGRGCCAILLADFEVAGNGHLNIHVVGYGGRVHCIQFAL